MLEHYEAQHSDFLPFKEKVEHLEENYLKQLKELNEIAMRKERLHWVDAAKGILIVLVAVGHMIQRGDELGISCSVFDVLKLTELFWSVFYMATFFILSGFWGKFDLNFKDFIVKKAKVLLLPLIIFSYLGGILHELFYEILKHTYNAGALEYPSIMISIDYWFVLALFIAHIFYWGICKLTNKWSIRWAIIALVYVVGVFSLKVWFIPNYACWKWAMIMMIYLPLGQVFKKGIQNWWLFVLALISFLGTWMMLYCYDIGFPYTTGGMKNMDLVRALPSFILCTAGSFVFIKLCSLIKRARVLELIGRNTLAIYVMHWWIEILAMKVMRSLFSQGVWVSTAAVLVTLMAAVFIPCLLSELLNRPKLRWTLGK